MQRKPPVLVPIAIKVISNIDAVSSDNDNYGFSKLYKQARLKLKHYPFLWLGVFVIIVVFASIYFRNTYVWEHTSFGDKVRPVRRKACIILNLQDNTNLTAVNLTAPPLINENRFDWKNYLQLNGDLPQNGIVDKKSAWNHWKNYGIKEKRQYRFTNDSRLINEGPLNIGVMIIYESSDKRYSNYFNMVMLDEVIV